MFLENEDWHNHMLKPTIQTHKKAFDVNQRRVWCDVIKLIIQLTINSNIDNDFADHSTFKNLKVWRKKKWRDLTRGKRKNW